MHKPSANSFYFMIRFQLKKGRRKFKNINSNKRKKRTEPTYSPMSMILCCRFFGQKDIAGKMGLKFLNIKSGENWWCLDSEIFTPEMN